MTQQSMLAAECEAHAQPETKLCSVCERVPAAVAIRGEMLCPGCAEHAVEIARARACLICHRPSERLLEPGVLVCQAHYDVLMGEDEEE